MTTSTLFRPVATRPVQVVSFGTTITRLRRRSGMSQIACAELVGRTPDWLSKVENDRIPVDRLTVLKELARVLDVDVFQLIEAAL
ncbi:helix-turn-helix domain-containing protein [Cryptosporangium aurantiacum]|uniref:Helix-turn-helix domain-containing protein n=1 Tax=Cryptosporangium aurantiacum TaxID=134849 RepID=A0A1M7QU06_9ACTN|nr:helix-turn-helix transcriptional regulator [Cryptosporangium aurantiacum]SHN35269.1 Helix-turn-helix domain-containing protein [Cryptosporangium aurantiacum]